MNHATKQKPARTEPSVKAGTKKAAKEVVHQVTEDDVIRAKDLAKTPLIAARGDDDLMSKPQR